jgi:hypothetical protein
MRAVPVAEEIVTDGVGHGNVGRDRHGLGGHQVPHPQPREGLLQPHLGRSPLGGLQQEEADEELPEGRARLPGQQPEDSADNQEVGEEPTCPGRGARSTSSGRRKSRGPTPFSRSTPILARA